MQAGLLYRPEVTLCGLYPEVNYIEVEKAVAQGEVEEVQGQQ